MATTSEKRALGFFAGVLLLGAGVRAVGATAGASPAPDARARADLHRQIVAVDSARRAGGRAGRGRRPASGRKSGRGTPSTDSTGGTPGPAPTAHGGSWAEPSAPQPVYYVRERRPSRTRLGSADSVPAAAESFAAGLAAPVRVDVDVASAAELERLPRIGPALAQRIVADRDAHGPFGSLTELMRVPGIGPAIARTLAPFVTFTLTPRQSPEGEAAAGAGRGGAGRRLRKPRSP